jgi:hypothetical protein
MTNNRTIWHFASSRMHGVAVAALAVIALIAMLAGSPARADSDDSEWIASIDLGVSVSGVTKTSDGVRTFLVGLGPKMERAIINACENYMETPGAIIGPDTLTFCTIAVRR